MMERALRNRSGGGRTPSPWLALALVLAFGCGAVASSLRGQDISEEEFTRKSLAFRTALHYDPLLDPPLDSLVTLYRGAERLDELVGLYRSHIAQFPGDAVSKTVLVRLLRRIDRAGADELIAAAAPQHPDFAPLQYVLHRMLEERGDPRAAEVLSRAIELQTDPNRRNEWLDQLLQLSERETARAFAEAHFNKLLAVENQSSDQYLSLARLMQRHQFWESSLVALAKAKSARPGPEAEVEIELMTATALGHAGEREDAGRMLDALLRKLAPDHWRRREILSLRMSLPTGEAEREALLSSFKKAHLANPQNERIVLDYAEALVAAEKRDEAVAFLLETSAALPKSGPIETRTLELLETSAADPVYARFLEDRLESDPGRLDLRFRLVKANYALGRDAAAEQDFRTVVAGLEPSEASARILELQRFLRSIDRIDAASVYLERYLRDHPSRLDVARELAEIHLVSPDGGRIDELVRGLDASEAEVENVLDFGEFLLENGFAHAAGTLVSARLETEPRQFDLGLLLIRILGKTGDEAGVRGEAAVYRELADTAVRYGRWLDAAIEAHHDLETLAGFFASEQNRFDFEDGAWTEDKISRYLLLGEAGKRKLFTGKVVESVRKTLAKSGLEPSLKLRLREFLVDLIERDPASAPEAEEQLKLLAAEDPAHRIDYDLRRALVYHRSQRVDLAQSLLAGIDLGEVGSAPILREAADVLIEYGFLREADTALAGVNRLEPGDLLSWERRLTVLAKLGEESVLRGILRSLRSGDLVPGLRELSERTLDEHLYASYWRSIAKLAGQGDTGLAETLAILASVEREDLPAEARLWVEWTRAFVLTRLGRTREAGEAMARFSEAAKEQELASVRFPDGLSLSVEAAAAYLDSRTLAKDETPPVVAAPADFLLGAPRLRWVFELPDEARTVGMGAGAGHVVILDDAGFVQGLEEGSGKLLWRRYFGESGRSTAPRRPSAFDAVPKRPTLGAGFSSGSGSVGLEGDWQAAKAPRSFAVAEDRFFLLRGDSFGAYSVASGSLLWSAELPDTSEQSTATPGARADAIFAVEGTRAVVFEPTADVVLCFDTVSGKLLWELSLSEREVGEDEAALVSLNVGLSLGGGHAFVYGRGAAIIDLAVGRVAWRFGDGEPLGFPIVLRLRREGEGDPAAPAESEVVHYLAGEKQEWLDLSSFAERPLDPGLLDRRTALLSPGVYWAKSRHRHASPAHATLSGSDLWLMQSGRVRRLSTDLPFSSSELPAAGAYVGRVGGHAWFLEGDILHHLDFPRDRASRLAMTDLGDPASLRATLSGNQLVVRGAARLKVVNARTGQVIGQSNLPPQLAEHATLLDAGNGDAPLATATVWQGRLRRSGPGGPAYVRPVADLLVNRRLVADFGRGLVACLEPSPPAGTAPPPAPPAN